MKVLEQSECLYTLKQVTDALDKLANRITAKLENSNPILLCSMIGGIVTTGKLLPRLNFPLQLDYVHVTRYEQDSATNNMKWITYPRISLEKRTVLIIDDILDGGLTLSEIVKFCNSKKADNILTAVLVNKEVQREDNGHESADFVGINVPNRYVYGCGMDYKGYLRNAPGIYAVT